MLILEGNGSAIQSIIVTAINIAQSASAQLCLDQDLTRVENPASVNPYNATLKNLYEI
jgi:hypothetical protein